jgi:hypothetical protein
MIQIITILKIIKIIRGGYLGKSEEFCGLSVSKQCNRIIQQHFIKFRCTDTEE